MAESGDRRRRYAAAFVLKCAIIGFCGQRLAIGAELPIPSEQGNDTLRAVQESSGASLPAGSSGMAREIESSARSPSRKQRRRKPQMAGVPAGTPVLVQEEVRQAGAPAQPQLATQESAPASASVASESKVAAQEAGAENPTAVIPAVNRLPAKPAKVAAEADQGRKYSLAPLKIKGGLSETLYWERSASEGRIGATFGHLQTAEINVATYVLQRWIAEVEGGIGLVHFTRSGDAGKDSGNSLYGNVGLALFNRSRFPFGFKYTATDSRSSGEVANLTKTQSLMLSQAYRPQYSNAKYKTIYQRSASDTVGSNSGNNVYSSLYGGYDERIGKEHSVNATLNFMDRDPGKRSNVTTRELRTWHVYLPVDSLLSRRDEAYFQESLSQGNRRRFLQALSSLTWQPEDEDLDLFVSGNARLFASTAETPLTGRTLSRLVSSSGAVSYRVTPKLTFGGDESISISNNAGKTTLSSVQRVRANYAGERVRFGRASYGWSASTSAGISTKSHMASSRLLTGKISHSMTSPYSLNLFGRKEKFNLNFSQSLEGRAHSADGTSTMLNNNASISWGLGLRMGMPGISDDKQVKSGGQNDFSSRLTLAGADSRTIGGRNPVHNRSASLMLDWMGASAYSISGYGSTLNFRAGVVRQNDGRVVVDAGTNGTGTYRKLRPFGVRGLVYAASFDINTKLAGVGSSPSGSTNSQGLNYGLDQRLTYRLGENEVRLNGYIANQNGTKSSSIFLILRAWRNFRN